MYMHIAYVIMYNKCFIICVAVGMPKSMVPRYTKLQDMLSTTSLSTNSLSTSQDPSTKKYRFELQKNINIIVNSVSANSGEGLIDKISKLKNLMGGKTMGKSVSISQHPEAKLYCYNLFSRKLVVSVATDVCYVCVCMYVCTQKSPSNTIPPVTQGCKLTGHLSYTSLGSGGTLGQQYNLHFAHACYV